MIFQATLGGKMKGRSVQYHSNISKDEGRVFYEKFITLCEVFLCSWFSVLSKTLDILLRDSL